jgi:ABC-2 type transport system ATP-binding protein
VFLTTQYIEEADQLADRIAIVDAGAIIAQGTPRDLKAAHGRTTITFEHDGDITAVGDAVDGAEIEIGLDARGRTVVRLDPATSGNDDTLRVLDRIRGTGISPTHLAVSEASLEDVFVGLTGTSITTSTGSTSSEDEG